MHQKQDIPHSARCLQTACYFPTFCVITHDLCFNFILNNFSNTTPKLTSVLLTQYCAGGKIEKNEMGGVCGVYGGGERCAQGSGGET